MSDDFSFVVSKILFIWRDGGGGYFSARSFYVRGAVTR